MEFEYDTKNLLYVRIDRKRKFLASVFLRALGLRGADEIIRTFYSGRQAAHQERHALLGGQPTASSASRAAKDIVVPGENFTVQSGKKITKNAVEALKQANVEAVEISDAELEGAFAAADVVDPSTGEVILEANEPLEPRVISMAQEKNVDRIEIFFPERDDVGLDHRPDAEEGSDPHARGSAHRDLPPPAAGRSADARQLAVALREHVLQPAEIRLLARRPAQAEHQARAEHAARREDPAPAGLLRGHQYLLKLRKNPANVDDIDHLGNRRVRSVGELLENQFRIGLVRMERAIKEKMSVYQEMATAMPHDLINAKPVMAAIREFFGSSQLSQFMDQTNPLSEITHKRRLSALGPGGLSRERAGFEVRDVHPTHYGRICPIETPEGPNIGLISSLSCYARINEFGFIESPLPQGQGRPRHRLRASSPTPPASKLQGRRHRRGRRAGRRRRAAEEEGRRVRALLLLSVGVGRGPAHHRAGQRGGGRQRQARRRTASTRAQAGNFILVAARRTCSSSTSRRSSSSRSRPRSIPFLENDDANRALMGSNMQRQAVPLLRARAPFVGTGMEYITARDSGAVIVARRSGTIDYVDSQRIVVRVESETRRRNLSKEMGADIYPMTKFKRSNQNTCITQKPIVRVGPEGAQGPGAGRRPVHRAWRAGARPERAGRVHAVARLQLRGRDPRVRADGEGRLLHVHPHRGVRDRVARHQARAGRNHARHPERLGGVPAATSTTAASSASAPTSSRATSWSARSRRRARRS